MFVGHYSVSFALKTEQNKIPLWVLFVAVQLIDFLWAIFVLLGVEKVHIVPGITASSPLDLYYMPYTHSLIGVVCWSALAFVVYKYLRNSPPNAALLVALAVFSHWVLDLIVHRPDLALYDDTFKVGFGLWNYKYAAFGLECALLLGGMLLYLRSNPGITPKRKAWTIIFTLILLMIQAATVFVGRPISSDKTFALSALIFYTLFAGAAFFLDRTQKSIR